MVSQYSASGILAEGPLKKTEITLPITEHRDNKHVLVASECLSPWSAALLISNRLQNLQATILYCWISLQFNFFSTLYSWINVLSSFSILSVPQRYLKSRFLISRSSKVKNYLLIFFVRSWKGFSSLAEHPIFPTNVNQWEMEVSKPWFCS